jgi:hypothetical protein
MTTRKHKKVVSSKVEITKPTKLSVGKNTRGLSLHRYHTQVGEMGKKIKKFAVGLSPENLLSVKMALMEAVRDVEEMIRERREEIR